MNDNLIEGALRSSPLPLDVRGGTRLFLSYEKGWFVVHTRFENFKKSKKIGVATAYYEDILSGKIEL